MRVLVIAAQGIALALQGAPEAWPLVPPRYHPVFHATILAGQGFVGAAFFIKRKVGRRRAKA